MCQIRELMEKPQQFAALMDSRVRQIEREVEELNFVKDLCMEIRDWEFGALDPGLVEMKLEWKKNRKELMKKDRIDWLCRGRDMAFLFCFMCIASMIAFPVNQMLGIVLPEKVFTVWRAVITFSPFPALILGALTAGRARWDVPRMDRIMVDSGNPLVKKESVRGRLYERVYMAHQAGLVSLVILPLNRLLGISLPLWVMIIWAAVIVGLTAAVMVFKNKS